MPQQIMRFRRVPGKMHRQIKNLAKHKQGVNQNEFIIAEIKDFLARCPDTAINVSDSRQAELKLTGIPERLLKEFRARVKNRYGLDLDRFMIAFLILVLERHPEYDKEKQQM